MTDRQQSFYFIAIVFLFTCGASLLVFRSYDQYYQLQTSTDLESVSNPPVETAPASDLTGWKLFSSKTYGFEFNYPSTFVSNISNDGSYYFKAANDNLTTTAFSYSLTTYQKQSGQSLKSFAEQQWPAPNYAPYTQQIYTQIGGKDAFEYSDVNQLPGSVPNSPIIMVFIDNGKNIIFLSLNTSLDTTKAIAPQIPKIKSEIADFNKTLSTFKFTK